MSANLQVAKVAELALGKIGAFTTNMLAPDPDDLARTIKWMDMVVAELAGNTECFWLHPATTTSPLTANIGQYTLSTLLGTSYPSDGILFPVAAYIRDSSGEDVEVDLISRDKYESIDNKATTGKPEFVYIDRLVNTSQIYLHPIPNDATYSLRLVFQTYAPNLTSGSPAGAGNVAARFSSEWNKWLVTATAAEIGDGPVRRLPTGEITGFRRDAGMSLNALIGYANREKTTSPKRTQAAF